MVPLQTPMRTQPSPYERAASTASIAVQVAFIIGAAAACSTLTGSGDDNSCNSPFDCKQGWACVGDKCVKACIVDEDCSGADDACLDGVCVDGAQYSCNADSDCTRPAACTITEGATCIDSQCSYIRSEDGTSCREAPCELGGLCAGSCLHGSCVECVDDNGCGTGLHCVLNRCEPKMGLGTWCTGEGQGTCANALKCEAWICCDATGPNCCEADSDCGNGFACNIAVASCFAACEPLTGSGCADPATMHCDGSACTPRLPTGSSCALADQCVSSHCVDGVCCESACDGICESCSALLTGQADGSCGPMLAEKEDLQPTISCASNGIGCAAASCACRGDGTRDCAVSVGHPCSSNTDCATDTCECADADCVTKQCVSTTCGVCEYLSAGACTSGLGQTVAVADDNDCDILYACHAGVCLGEPGAACIDSIDCDSGICECADPQCDTRKCSAVACNLCKYTTGASCDGDIIPDPTATSTCSEGDVYWYDSCGARTTLKETCGAAGCLGSACVTAPITVGPLYRGHANWNSFVDNDGADAFHATGTTCTVGGGSGAPRCIHAGEKLMASGIGFDSCTDLSMRDSLGAFDWVCDDTGTTSVVFYSRGLKENARLADLVSATAWSDNFVELVSGGTTVIHSSLSAPWWNNAVIPVSTSSSALSEPGAVYVVEGTLTAIPSYTVDAHGVSVVVLPGSRLLGAISTSALLSVSQRNFIWLEGDFATDDSTQTCLSVFASHYVTVRWATATGCAMGARVTGGSTHTSLRHLQVSDSTLTGLWLSNSANVLLSHVRVNNGAARGIYSDRLTGVTGTHIITTSNMQTGLQITGTVNGAWAFITAANNGRGISIVDSANQAVTQIVSVNNVIEAMALDGVSDSSFAQWVLADSWVVAPAEVPQLSAIDLSDITFSGALLAGPGTAPCSVVGGTAPGILDATCLASGSSTHVVLPLSGTSPLQNSFVGKTGVTDTVNASNTNGLGTRATITDWTHFENIFRSWGMDGTYGTAGSHGRCRDPGCAIWDWSLRASSTHIRGNSGDGSTQNSPVTPGTLCPEAVNGTRALSAPGADPGHKFLINAYEVTLENESGGDGDGLCESFETCVYAPNFGAYQGSGEWVEQGCVFADDVDPFGVQGVRILSFTNNGE